ncbi:hypothetical protein Leryth_005690 [Lithospermum erythrorhizon]|nr:hypothetical protein Leryth_005690 [Lithospermum erythrorhizon]
MIRGGKNYVASPPAFSNDAKKILICSANTVSIFSTSTGLLIGELEGHTAQVSSVIVVPATSGGSKVLCYCWTSSLDGTIRYWDFAVSEWIKTIDIRFPVYSMVIPSFLSQPREGNAKPRDIFAYICTAQEKEQTANLFGRIQKCNLSQSRLVGNLILGETETPGPIAISPSGKYIGIQEKRKLRIWETPNKDSDHASYKKIRLHHTKSLTTLAFHPTESIIAAGDVTGRILIWRGVGHRGISGGNSLISGGLDYGDAEERPGVRGNDDADSCTTWHWHPGQVDVLFFSSDGAYLYSGGREGVLVVWQLDTGKKKFLPRIGSPLLHYISSPDPTMSSISCADNQIHILKMPSLEIQRSISGIKPRTSVPEMYKGSSRGIAFDQSSAVASVCTDNYCVQFYSLLHDQEVTEVRICERNHQPGEEVTIVVNLVSLSWDGSTMCTVESRSPEEGIGGLQSLKFWSRSPHDKSFSLSTVIYDPHREAAISDIAFHPNRPMAVTSSYGSDFKVWVCNETQQKDQTPLSLGWTCHAVASYKKKQMTAATFSGDGSVLAVAAETVITLWDPDRNILVAVIGETVEPITTLSFVGKSKYLVSTSHGSNPLLCLWSMSSLALSWSCKLFAQDIACSLDGTTFAVLAMSSDHSQSDKTSQISDGIIIIFTVEKPVPVATWFAKKATAGALAFVQSNVGSEESMADEKPNELLAYMNNDREYVLFDPLGKEAIERSVPHETAVGLEEAGRFGYASVYGELPEFKLEERQDPLISSVPRGRTWDTLFSGPSHTLPPMTKLCSVFLESLLERRNEEVE